MSRTPFEQFASDYLLVAMKDQNTYNYLMDLVKENDSKAFRIAEQLCTDYETTMLEMIGAGDSVDKLLARKMLLNWGIETFLIIARYLIEVHNENMAVA